jgi:hypothetical protein
VIIYCRVHGKEMGVVDRHPIGGFVRLSVREPRWRDRYAAEARLEGRYNSFQNLEGRAGTTIPAAGCRGCGPRELPIQHLVAAFAAGLPYINA